MVTTCGIKKNQECLPEVTERVVEVWDETC